MARCDTDAYKLDSFKNGKYGIDYVVSKASFGGNSHDEEQFFLENGVLVGSRLEAFVEDRLMRRNTSLISSI